MARAAVAAGADGLLIEVHHDPDHALSDGAQSLFPAQFDRLMAELRIIAPAIGRSICLEPVARTRMGCLALAGQRETMTPTRRADARRSGESRSWASGSSARRLRSRHGGAGRRFSSSPSIARTYRERQAPCTRADVGGEDLALRGSRGPDRPGRAGASEHPHSLPSCPITFAGEAVVTDVGSTKRQIASAAAALPTRLPFIGGHPLAGAAIGGLECGACRSVHWPPLDSDASRPIRRRRAGEADALRRRPGRARARHDARGARCASGVSQPSAAARGERADASRWRTRRRGRAGAGGPRACSDTTRLASSPPDIWRDIASTNQDNIAQAIDELIEVLLSLKPGSRPTDDDPMGTVFESAARWKRVLEAGREHGMSGRRVIGTRTFLEMRERAHLVRGRLPDAPGRRPHARLRAGVLAVLVQRDWPRLPLGRPPAVDDRARSVAYMADPQVSIWLSQRHGRRRRVLRVARDPDDNVEIVYFGLFKHFHGRGLGGHFPNRSSRARLGCWRPTSVAAHQHVRSSGSTAELPQAGVQGPQDRGLHARRLKRGLRNAAL